MNEKLREEIDSYIRENIRIESYSEFCDIAEHFYKLALADVKEMVERQQLANHSGTDEWIRAKQVAYESILDFIDEQSK